MRANPETKPTTARPKPSPLIDLASIWAVQLERRAREQVLASARTQLKIAAIAASQGAEGKASRALAAVIRKWMTFYNRQRPYSALVGRPPTVVYWQKKEITKPDQQEPRVA